MLLKKALLSAIAIGAMLAGSMARAENLETFRVGIIGGENEADRLRNYQCIVDQLPKVLGVKEVKLFPATDYDGVIQGLLGGTLDYAELGASGFAKIYLTNPKAVEPILTTVQTDGATGYYSIMVARKDSGIKSLADMKGKKLGFADPDSTSGYLIPCDFSSRRTSRLQSRITSAKRVSVAVTRTSCWPSRTASSMPAPPLVRVLVSLTKAIHQATCAKWSTKVSST